ncbi:hypothetical protein AXG93_517s1080 [Marchantia polymorpha subsp. ruderalis]|uniref:Uncharacterized protein n=1 Tax=Marchantia polymorpha subsp. ruderalis TaxID=1480154 RepID=A0A176VKX1_MARPO|nr:hypothetical protein AXG93_517s1080 [Marchantia polymorpha subsp. ruderalis]
MSAQDAHFLQLGGPAEQSLRDADSAELTVSLNQCRRASKSERGTIAEVLVKENDVLSITFEDSSLQRSRFRSGCHFIRADEELTCLSIARNEGVRHLRLNSILEGLRDMTYQQTFYSAMELGGLLAVPLLKGLKQQTNPRFVKEEMVTCASVPTFGKSCTTAKRLSTEPLTCSVWAATKKGKRVEQGNILASVKKPDFPSPTGLGIAEKNQQLFESSIVTFGLTIH